MQMRRFLIVFSSLMAASVSLAEGYALRAIAQDVCVDDVPGLGLEAQYVDDFVRGEITSRQGPALSFYVGKYPSFEDAISQESVKLDGLHAQNAIYRRHADGRASLSISLKGRKIAEQLVVFREKDGFVRDAYFLGIINSVRSCTIWGN